MSTPAPGVGNEHGRLPFATASPRAPPDRDRAVQSYVVRCVRDCTAVNRLTHSVHTRRRLEGRADWRGKVRIRALFCAENETFSRRLTGCVQRLLARYPACHAWGIYLPSCTMTDGYALSACRLPARCGSVNRRFRSATALRRTCRGRTIGPPSASDFFRVEELIEAPDRIDRRVHTNYLHAPWCPARAGHQRQATIRDRRALHRFRAQPAAG